MSGGQLTFGSVGGGSGGVSGQMFSSVASLAPADGSTTTLAAHVLTVVDAAAATSLGAVLLLPVAGSVSAGSIVGVKGAPTGSTGQAGYDGALTGSFTIKPSGTDLLDGALATDPFIFIFQSNVGGDQFIFVSDGVSHWTMMGVQPFTAGLTYYDPAQQTTLQQVIQPFLIGNMQMGVTETTPVSGNNMIVDGNAPVWLIGNAGITVTGIARSNGTASINVDGAFFYLYNAGSGNMTLKHLNAGSLAANRIYTPGAVDLVLPTFSGVLMIYNSVNPPFDVTPGWIVIGKA